MESEYGVKNRDTQPKWCYMEHSCIHDLELDHDQKPLLTKFIDYIRFKIFWWRIERMVKGD